MPDRYKSLFAKMERQLERIERADGSPEALLTLAERLVVDLEEDLGLLAVRIYRRDGDDLALQAEYPDRRRDEPIRIPISYPPVQEVMQQGWVLHTLEDPGVDRTIENLLEVRSFAAICVGAGREIVVAFSLADSSDRSHVIYTLNTIRHVINLKMRKEHLEANLEQARLIQASLLPDSAPRFRDFDIAGRSRPAEEVGGDLYDYIEVSDRSLGVAIADSAGHGLPAALQARDAIIGLRMSIEERWRITATIEKLNKVVGRSATISRFISLFYAELESNGTVVYCNAGHNPPFLLGERGFEELRTGGLILGPNPDALYERGYVHMALGDVLVLYTDGITEARGPQGGEMFGVDRLMRIVRESQGLPARAILDRVFGEVTEFGESPPADDQTVVVVRRDPELAAALPRTRQTLPPA